MTSPDAAAARPRTGGLLAVHAHPDDETLSTGGLLAAWAAAGRPVAVVTCTRGERGEVIPPELAALQGDGPALAARREAELAAALRCLGVGDHLFLDTVGGGSRQDGGADRAAAPTTGTPGVPGPRFEDSGMAWVATGRAAALDRVPDGAFVAVPLDHAAARLAAVLRDRRPDVVVTYEPGGGYGHPDHVHAHRVTMRAVELAADPGPSGEAPHAVAAVLWTAVPDDVLRAAHGALADLPVVRRVRDERPTLTLPDPAGPLPSVAVDPAQVDVRVDVAAVLERVADALRAHATQVGSVALGPTVPLADDVALAGCYALSHDVLAPLLTVEAYRYAPGSPRAAVAWPAVVRPVA